MSTPEELGIHFRKWPDTVQTLKSQAMVKLPFTNIAGIALGTTCTILTLGVIQIRRGKNIPSGDGGNELLKRRISGLRNFSEQAPLGIILLGLVEMNGAEYWQLAILTSALVVGRVIHGYTFFNEKPWMFGRVGGMVMTATSFMGSILCLAWQFLRST